MFLAAHASMNTAPKVAEGICQQYRNSQASQECDATTKPVPNYLGEPNHSKDEVQKRHGQV